MSINIRKAFTSKALDVYKEIKHYKADIVFLQEVGLSKFGKHVIQKTFPKMKVFTNLYRLNQKKISESQFTSKKHFKNPKRGVAVLINKELEKEFEIKQVYKDKKARSIIISLKSENKVILLGNVYAPAEGKRRNKKWIQNFTKTCKKLTKKVQPEILLAGDWNFHLDDLPSYAEQMCAKLKIKWLNNREEKTYTFTKWKKGNRKHKVLDGWFGTINFQNKLLKYKVNLNSDIKSDHKPVHISINQKKVNTEDIEESEILKRNKIIKQTVKKMIIKKWTLYKEKLEEFMKTNKNKWEKELSEIKAENINDLRKIIQEGSEEMIKIIMTTNAGQKVTHRMLRAQKKFQGPLPKKLRGTLKHNSRLLKLYNILEKIKNKKELSRKNRKLLKNLSKKKSYQWKLDLNKWEKASQRSIKKLQKWIGKSIIKNNKKEKVNKRLWAQERKTKKLEENNQAYSKDTKWLVNKYLKKKYDGGRIYKLSEETKKKYNINKKGPEGIDEYVVKYFSELFKESDAPDTGKKIWDKYYQNDTSKDEKMWQPIKLKEVEKVVKKIKKGKTGGLDGVVGELIKNTNEDVKVWLVDIFNKCMETGEIPEIWKISLIRMLKKDTQADLNVASNYRRIALLSIFYKLYASIITNRLYKIVEENKILGDLQCGFRKNKSTKAAIRILCNVYEDAKENDKELWAAFLDIQKAYDTVDFRALEEILIKFGFHHKTVQLILNMNKNLQCQVVFENSQSGNIKIERELRQGCPLSPLLFILFLEPMLKWISHINRGYTMSFGKKATKIPYTAFADDIAIYADKNTVLNKYIEAINKYLSTYSMKLNFNKSVATSTVQDKERPKMYDDTTKSVKDMIWLKKDESFKYLEIDINLNLTWNDCIKRNSKKIHYKLKKIKEMQLDCRFKNKVGKCYCGTNNCIHYSIY